MDNERNKVFKDEKNLGSLIFWGKSPQYHELHFLCVQYEPHHPKSWNCQCHCSSVPFPARLTSSPLAETSIYQRKLLHNFFKAGSMTKVEITVVIYDITEVKKNCWNICWFKSLLAPSKLRKMVQNGPFRRISHIFKIAGLEPKLSVIKPHHQKQIWKAHKVDQFGKKNETFISVSSEVTNRQLWNGRRQPTADFAKLALFNPT